jgi:hypothetical protein
VHAEGGGIGSSPSGCGGACGGWFCHDYDPPWRSATLEEVVVGVWLVGTCVQIH